MQRIRSFLLLFALLAHGGTAVGARSLEEAEGGTSVVQEVTFTRADFTVSKRLRERRALEIERGETKRESPSRHHRLRSADEKSPYCEYFGPPPPSRAPPALV